MSKKFNFTKKNERSGRIENVGYLDMSANEEKTKASLYFYGDIVSSTWESWWYGEESKCPQDIADFLNELEDYEDIDIYFNSGGGEVFAGLAIYNQLRRFKGHKVGYVDGISASISSVIMFACDELHFSTGSLAMIHKPATYGYGNAIELQKAIDRLNTVEESILDVYMQHTKDGVTREQLKELMAEETWFDSDSIEEIFNLEIEEKAAVAASMSDFYNRYKNRPVKEKPQITNGSIDKKDISDAVNEAVNKCFAEREKSQKEKEEILKDLYKFGV